MSRRQTIRVGLEKRSSSRPVLQSLDICQSPSSRITICSQPHGETSCIGNLSATSSCQKIFCTTQTCSNSQSCMQSCPDLCPHGLKDVKNDDKKCSQSCHNHVLKSSIKNFETTDDTTYGKSEPSSRCAGAISITTVRDSSNLTRFMSSCGTTDKSPSSLSGTPEESPSISSIPTETQYDDEENTADKYFCCSPSINPASPPTAIKSNVPNETQEAMNCCTDIAPESFDKKKCCSKYKDLLESKGISTGKPAAGPVDKKIGNIKFAKDLVNSDTPPRLKASSFEGLKDCCTPPPASSITDPRKKSAARPSFKVSDIKVNSSEDMKQKNDSCLCTNDESSVQKKCACHFPPAYNQFGCTGNISGNCNCDNSN